MNRSVWSLVVARLSVVALAVALVGGSVFAQEAAKPKAAAGEKKPAARAQPKGRLPAQYGKIVNEAQREAIYKLQSAFAAKKEALEKQLAALKAEEDAAIEAVLTPEQKQKLAARREEAKAAREKRAAERKAAAGEDENAKPAEKPAAKKAA
jgi:hypothetical protein